MKQTLRTVGRAHTLTAPKGVVLVLARLRLLVLASVVLMFAVRLSAGQRSPFRMLRPRLDGME